MFNQFRKAVISRYQTGTAKIRQMSSGSVPNTPFELGKYGTGMQLFHFATGGSILVCVGLVNLAQYQKGKKKMNTMFYHKSFGLLAAGLMVPRLLIRLTSKIPSPIPGPVWEVMAAHATHAALYAFMIFMPVSGIVMGYYGGKGLPFFWTSIPGAEKADGKIAKQAFENHKLVGHYAQYLIPMHVGAVGFHYFIKGRNILPRIFPMKSSL